MIDHCIFGGLLRESFPVEFDRRTHILESTSARGDLLYTKEMPARERRPL